MSDVDYRRGEADMDVYSLAAYGLWMGENGQFADIVARLGTAKTDMTIDGNKKGSMDNIVTALSGEFGWRFDLSKSFYLEPQVELAYTHVDADDLSLSDGSTYRFDDADSLMGRAGFAFGMRCPENGNTAYLRVSAVHEFLGDNAVTGGNGKVYEIDGKDTWVEYGPGPTSTSRIRPTCGPMSNARAAAILTKTGAPPWAYATPSDFRPPSSDFRMMTR